ncbi:type B DNA-directed DNA polymerase [Halanaeroarchaeum sulfurireducens]|uniref:DNA-directed DNA polymerase n=1 Tax=Halanaeroarchaeum sulfurireducens TaxID=1604004 RepID=A0A0F7PDF4_9EURY|nr:type B DNA-directed DNA polymerase [Halanaeroarchaeum sulfurireducens]AKH97368.1 DNA polymerase I [Halanaeroarchaeum sulfurireducens]ALG81770.1 DNA polymerase I [Halanaeroarchaeum sulfurireducens]
MTFKVDYLDEGVLAWESESDGATVSVDEDYRPTIYLAADEYSIVEANRAAVDDHPNVVKTARESWRRGFRHDHEPMLRIDVADIDAVTPVARQLSTLERAGDLRLFNVDFSREFRYCLETECIPADDADLSTLSLAAPPTELAADDPGVREATVDGQTVTGDPVGVLDTVLDRVQHRDPDVLVLGSADIVPQLFAVADEHELGPVRLGRRPGYQRLAGRSTYESYGRVGHSPARYNVPGRAIIDRSNTFFYHETNLAGCLDLVGRSGKPLQELAWASIGNVLTAMQIHEALDRDVLVPWRSWRHERFKSMRTLDDADRGGHTITPAVGLHETVHELDFSSLYPSIIVGKNISPETIRGDCEESETVPRLGYDVCTDRGYLPDVLAPLIEDREAIKTAIRETDDPDRRQDLQGRSGAIKWILVSCFGYQGFSNAKFGRIEAHEAINAYARDILLTAKEALEAAGWRVVHGIVDSVWVTPRADEPQDPLESVAAAVSEDVGIDLEYEAAYDWVAFVPRREGSGGALTKYFGRYATPQPDGTAYKYRGIEARQRSTCEWVTTVQRTLVATLDEHRRAEPVLDRLAVALARLDRGDVDPDRLVVTNRVSRRVEEYTQATRNVAALERAAARGLERFPGQDVEYVVVDDEKDSRERVALASENPATYDTSFYWDRAIRAAESVVSPLGWDRERIREYLAATTATSLSAFESGGVSP